MYNKVGKLINKMDTDVNKMDTDETSKFKYGAHPMRN